MVKDNWSKYKSRGETARVRISNKRNEMIQLRATKGDMDIKDAIKLTDDERYMIEKEGVYNIYTKEEWERRGYPIVKKLDTIPLWNNWKDITRK